MNACSRKVRSTRMHRRARRWCISPIWILSRGSLSSQTSSKGSSEETFIHAFIHSPNTHRTPSVRQTPRQAQYIQRKHTVTASASTWPHPTPHILKLLFSLCPLPPPFSATCLKKSSTKSLAWPSPSLTGWHSGRGMNWRSKPGCSRQRRYKYICIYINIYM